MPFVARQVGDEIVLERERPGGLDYPVDLLGRHADDVPLARGRVQGRRRELDSRPGDGRRETSRRAVSLGAHAPVPIEGGGEGRGGRLRPRAPAARPVPDREVARAARRLGTRHRPGDLGSDGRRRGRAPAHPHLGAAARAAEPRDHGRHPLRHALEPVRHHLQGRPLERAREARLPEAERALRRRARRAGLHFEHPARRPRGGDLARSPTRPTASRSRRITAGRSASSCRRATSGRAPSGFAGFSSSTTTSPGSGSGTATTTTPTSTRKSATRSSRIRRSRRVSPSSESVVRPVVPSSSGPAPSRRHRGAGRGSRRRRSSRYGR